MTSPAVSAGKRHPSQDTGDAILSDIREAMVMLVDQNKAILLRLDSIDERLGWAKSLMAKRVPFLGAKIGGKNV